METPVIIKNKNRKQLIGILHFPKGKKKFPLVIFCHGFGGTKTKRKYVRLARAFKKAGIASFRFDFEGCGDSEGDFEKITVKREVSDLDSVIKYFLKQKIVDKKKISFLGNSLGAAVCITYIIQNNFPAKAIAFWAPALNQEKLFSNFYTKNNFKKWKKQRYLIVKEDKIGTAYLKENEKKNYSEFIPQIKVPILIIHGKKDEAVPFNFSKKLVKDYKNIKLFPIPGANHGFEDYYSQQKLVEKTVNWFKKYK